MSNPSGNYRVPPPITILNMPPPSIQPSLVLPPPPSVAPPPDIASPPGITPTPGIVSLLGAVPVPGVPPPPAGLPPPIHQVPPPVYRAPPVYSHTSYSNSGYPSSYSYYTQYRPSVPPPSMSAYPPPSTPPYLPPRPATEPPAGSHYSGKYSNALTEEEVKYHLEKWNTPKPSIKLTKAARTERLSTPALPEPGSKEGNCGWSRDSTPSFSNRLDSVTQKVKQEKKTSERVQERDRSRSSHREYDRGRERSWEREYSRNREYAYDRERDRERRYRDPRSRSPSYSSHHYRSPSRYSERERRLRELAEDKERKRRWEKERYLEEKRYYERRRYEKERLRSPSRHKDYRSQSRSSDALRYRRSPSRSSSYFLRESESQSHREHSQLSQDRLVPRKPLTDREKILEEYRKNYCRTSDDLVEKIEKWSREHNSDDEEQGTKLWYRSSPAELYYKRVEGGTGVEQTKKLEKLVETFYTTLIERGRKARPEVDELPPLKARPRMCSKHDADKSSSSSSSSDDDDIDEDGLQGYTDRIMLELQRKQSHPRRLHPEMWFNNTGEMNGGPLCRCSVRARRFGMRHGVYAGEQAFPKCIPTHSNIDKLYHYRITVSPPTNFLIKNPTIIGHDEHEFLFSGFSMFSHYKLAKLPTCKVIRFNIEYTILYVEEPAPENFTVQELDYFEEFIFTELLELVDLDLGRGTETTCSQFHFMPRFVRLLAEGGCEVLSMCEVIKYMIEESRLLIPPEKLNDMHSMDHYNWQKFVDKIKGMIVTYPGKKPCSVRVDQLDRSPPQSDDKTKETNKDFYPEIVHFGIRPPQLSYAGNPEYQKAWRYYVKYRHLIANMAKPTYKERTKLAAKEAKLQEMRTQSKMKRDVTVAMSSEGFHTTGLMCDVVQHAMLIPVLVRHLRFHKSLEALEKKIGYVFKQRLLLQTALTHPSYRENFGTNPDHARNSLTNCGIRQPEYGDRRIHYTRKKGIVTLINIMSRFGKHNETESEIKHNERLEFLGDAVVEFISSIHLFRMFPGLAEGGLATYRASIVQNQHLAQLAKNIELEQFMLYAHGSDLCREVVMKHAMANCFEALMGALFLDAGLQVADQVFALALWYNDRDLYDVWLKERPHPLQEQEPLGDRRYIKDFEFLQKLTEFEKSIGVEFKHIRLLARAFTDRSVGFTHLTLGSNQRLEFLGDTVLQLVVSDKLYRYFPDHHEGHLSLLRSSLVNNRTQSMVCDDLNMSAYAIYNNPKAKPTTKKHKADLLEAFLGALYIDKSLDYCIAFCNACLFPRLQEFIMNQDWNDPKSKLQQCCLTLRSMEGGEPDIPLYKVIECMGPTNTRVYTVGVYFRGIRLASARGHSIQEAEMNAAEEALTCAHQLFPQLDHQKRVIAKSMRKKKKGKSKQGGSRSDAPRQDDKVPKAYRLDQAADDSDDSVQQHSDEEANKNNDDSGLDSDPESLPPDKLDNIEVSTLISDMEKVKAEMIRKNEYDKLKEKCRQSDSDED